MFASCRPPIRSRPSYPKLGLGPRTVWKLCGSSFMAASKLSALDCCQGDREAPGFSLMVMKLSGYVS